MIIILRTKIMITEEMIRRMAKAPSKSTNKEQHNVRKYRNYTAITSQNLNKFNTQLHFFYRSKLLHDQFMPMLQQFYKTKISF